MSPPSPLFPSPYGSLSVAVSCSGNSASFFFFFSFSLFFNFFFFTPQVHNLRTVSAVTSSSHLPPLSSPTGKSPNTNSLLLSFILFNRHSDHGSLHSFLCRTFLHLLVFFHLPFHLSRAILLFPSFSFFLFPFSFQFLFSFLFFYYFLSPCGFPILWGCSTSPFPQGPQLADTIFPAYTVP